jgi:gas vesicle protein
MQSINKIIKPKSIIMNTEGKIAVGVLAGLAAGAILGVLFAPAKGTETRKMLTERSQGLLNGAKGKLNEAKDAVSDQLGSTSKMVGEVVNQVTSKPESLKKEFQNNQASNEKNHQNSVTNQNRH